MMNSIIDMMRATLNFIPWYIRFPMALMGFVQLIRLFYLLIKKIYLYHSSGL